MATVSRSHRRFVAAVVLFSAVFWGLLAIKPHYRSDWALENVVVAVSVALLFLSWRWYAFSRTSYVLIGLFFCLHAIGSHFTYSEVPYDAAFRKLTGHSLNGFFGWERNHFDRLVHFLYGLLLTLPFREATLHFAKIRWAFWSYLLPVCFILASSLIYELLEWAAAAVFGGDLGMAFLGTQGDVWDSQKDSLCALVGALLATVILAGLHLASGRDATRDWVERQDAKAKPAIPDPA